MVLWLQGGKVYAGCKHLHLRRTTMAVRQPARLITCAKDGMNDSGVQQIVVKQACQIMSDWYRSLLRMCAMDVTQATDLR